MLEGSYYSLYYLRYVRPHAGMSWSGINVVLARVYTLAGRSECATTLDSILVY